MMWRLRSGESKGIKISKKRREKKKREEEEKKGERMTMNAINSCMGGVLLQVEFEMFS